MDVQDLTWRIDATQAEQVALMESLISLFQFLDDPAQESYSNTVELYDAIPKYFRGKTRIAKKLDPIERVFEWRGRTYRVEILPTKIRIKDKETNKLEWHDALPGSREEFVEDAIRKIGVDGGMFVYGDNVAVGFSNYELIKELARTGHELSKRQINQALSILAGCSLVLYDTTSESSQALYQETLIGKRLSKTEDGWDETASGKKSTNGVVLHSLVKRSILERSFRRYNYETCMKYDNFIARYLHKRMAHIYLQATITEPYSIRLSTIISGSGMKKYAKPVLNHKYVVAALNEMKAKGVLLVWEPSLTKDKSGKPDRLYTLRPTASFTKEIIAANKQGQSLGVGVQRLDGGS